MKWAKKGEQAMLHYAGLDVSKKSIFLSVVDQDGKEIKQKELPCDPEIVGAFLKGSEYKIKRIGLESGTYTHWLTKELSKMNFEVVVMEAGKMAAILASNINKNDTNDARGIAMALRAGYYTKCIHRSDQAMGQRTLLNGRDHLVKTKTNTSNVIKGLLRPYGINVCSSQKESFIDEVKEAVSDLTEDVIVIINSLLCTFENLKLGIKSLNDVCKKKAKDNEDIKRLKSMDGVGDLVALAFVSEVDDPKRFKKSRDLSAYLGLTPKLYSSGEIHRQGRISKKGSGYTRTLLVEAAIVLLTRVKVWSDLKAWGTKLMKKKGLKKAATAVARRMAVILHKMLLDKAEFRRSQKNIEQAA